MLDGMRKASQGLIGRIIMGVVMGVISLSFAIWGVGNVFVGFGAGKLGQVGGTEITIDAFRQAYQTQLQNLQRQARRPITNDQARAMGLDRQVLGQLVADAALDERAQALGLAMSDKEIAQKILVDPTFAGPTGKFDSGRFNDILRDNGYSEQTFVGEQRKVYLRQEVVDAVAGSLPVPVAMLDAIHRYRDETRSIDYIELPASAAGEIPAPADDVLQKYFDARKQNYRAPAYRKLVTLAITPTTLADPKAVTDEDARALYDRVKAQRYGTAETRQIEQVVFPDEATANEASAKIKAGASLADVATQMKLSVADLGVQTKDGIFDKPIANAAFALPEGGVSDPIKGQFGYVLVRDVKTAPEAVKPFADVSADLKQEVAVERGRKKADELRDKIEDERTSGKTLTEAAASVNLKPMTIEAIDQSGRDKAGVDVPGLVERDALLKAAFGSDIGVDNDTLGTKDGGYVWFEVAGVEQARDRTLDEARPQVEAAWRDDEIAHRLSDKAADLVKKLDAGQSMEDIAKAEAGLEVKHVADVRRVGTTSVPQGVVLSVFAVGVGQAGSAAGDSQTRIVFKLLDSATPPLDADSDVMKGVETQLRQSMSEDLLTQYLAKLQTDAGVNINEAALSSAVGGGAADQ